MTRTRITSSLGPLLALLVCAAVGAQARPDFSGRWTSDPEPSAAAAGGQRGARGGGRAGARGGDMGSGWGSSITITQDARQLTVEYVFFARGDLQPPLRFAYALDGSDTTSVVTMGRGEQRQTSTTAWDGGTLVITTVYPFTNPGETLTGEIVRRLSLESPTSLVVEATRPGVMGGPSSTTRTTYRRLPSGGH
jgi:hypothetical protein